ncbi:MAG: hypothetical protein K6E49_09040 [Lachnospiraceae bacterium]|nr:hypothetical protein [Lachnospiraceae bacterium]
MNRFKRAVAVIILAVSVMVLLAGCSANINVSTRPDNDAPAGSASSDDSMPEEDGSTDEEVPPRDQGIWFMGGLVSDEKGFYMKVAIYRLDGDGVAVVTDGEDIYYGEYETKDTGFDDGTPWTLIKVGGKQFGYYFGDNNDSFIVDNDNNRIKAVDMDEAAGMELFEATDMNDDFEGDISFLEEQSGVREFKDFDDIIAHLEPGQGYAYIKLTGSDVFVQSRSLIAIP